MMMSPLRATIKATAFVLMEVVEFTFLSYILLIIFSGSPNLTTLLIQPWMGISLALFSGGIAMWAGGAWVDKFTEYLQDGSKTREIQEHS
jgi:hypothetical protein